MPKEERGWTVKGWPAVIIFALIILGIIDVFERLIAAVT